jgi:hypothetical protein
MAVEIVLGTHKKEGWVGQVNMDTSEEKKISCWELNHILLVVWSAN